MEEKGFNKIVINKNRGWRGLAEASICDEDMSITTSMIFSFSNEVWQDLLHGYIVVPYKEYYYVIVFDNLDKLPKPTQQRSVLIKNFCANIKSITKVEQVRWTSSEGITWASILHHLNNSNKHTQSDWNYVGIRVTPTI